MNLILNMPPKTFTMLHDLYVTFMFNVSFPLYGNLNKTSDIWTNSPPPSNSREGMELLLLIVFLKVHMIFRERIVHTILK